MNKTLGLFIALKKKLYKNISDYNQTKIQFSQLIYLFSQISAKKLPNLLIEFVFIDYLFFFVWT